jgi:hypothetical protein
MIAMASGSQSWRRGPEDFPLFTGESPVGMLLINEVRKNKTL